MSKSGFYLTNADVLEKFRTTLDTEDDSDAWSKLPLTEDEKHDFLMESSKDPRVQELYAKIKTLREHIKKQEAELAISTESAPDEDEEQPTVAFQ